MRTQLITLVPKSALAIGCGIEVDLALGEVGVGAGMALSAGLDQVGRVDGGSLDPTTEGCCGYRGRMSSLRYAVEPTAFAMP